MEDIINLLKNVHAGLDGISVKGLDNQDMLLSCARGVRSAIVGLDGLLAAERDAKAVVKKEAEDIGG